MKRFFKPFGIIAMVAVIGLSMAGCGNCPADGNCEVRFASGPFGYMPTGIPSVCRNDDCAVFSGERTLASAETGATIRCDC